MCTSESFRFTCAKPLKAAACSVRRTLFALGLIVAPVVVAGQETTGIVKEEIRPSAADPAVRQFDDVNVVLTAAATTPNAPLALFLPGTNGKPLNALELMHVVAGQGYRVIGLTYDDLPAGTELCPRNPNPSCFTAFHDMRVFGHGDGPVSNPYNESIEARFSNLLRYLDREHPSAGWAGYLRSDGRPDWSRILVSGLSQGAGMAAFIAKSQPVYRVVLFSSPWDNYGRDHRPAPWLLSLL